MPQADIKTPKTTIAKSGPAKAPAKKAAAPVKVAPATKVTKPPKAAEKPAKVEKAVKPVKAVKVKTPVAKAVKPAPVAAKAAAEPKQKLVRDSFTMPRADFELIDGLKARALVFHRPVKKSELLRAGLRALAAQDDAQLKASIVALVPLKAGRPKKAD